MPIAQTTPAAVQSDGIGRARVVTATEAKTRLAELLRNAEQGETIAITRHGRPVAYLVSAAEDQAAARGAAVDLFLTERAQLGRPQISVAEILELVHEGRR